MRTCRATTSSCSWTPPKTRPPAPRHLLAAQRSTVVSETRVLRAIRALDSDDPLSDSPTRICEAFAFFLELLLMLDRAKVDDTNARAEVETIWEARILGSLQRFVSKRKHVEKTFVGCCNRLDAQGSLGRDHRCIQQLVCFTLVSIVYVLSRDPRFAVAIVKNSLHRFVFDIGGDLGPLPLPDQDQLQDHMEYSSASEGSHSRLIDSKLDDPIDAQDLLFSIDPFDWCYQSTCVEMTTKANHRNEAAILFVPVGVRSLRYLLLGEELPTDEITEYDRELRRRVMETNERQTPTRSPTRRKRAGSRRLPSIFAFPTATSLVHADTSLPSLSFPQCKLGSTPAFRVLSFPSALQHMVLRTAAVLLHNLPRTSPERKALVRSDSRCIELLVVRAYDAKTVALHQNDNTSEELEGPTELAKDHRLKSFQTLAMEPSVLSRIARSTLASLYREEVESLLKGLKPEYAAVLQHISSVKEPSPSSSPSKDLHSAAKSTKVISKAVKVAPTSAVSLADRLRAASEEAKREIGSCNAILERDRALQHSIRRQHLRARCEHLEQLRQQLGQSLSVLRSGRAHADPTQSFLGWIESLPTIEKMEQERHRTEHMRQQHAIEAQYQRDEARKREMKERTMMQQNDCNALDETEHSEKERKRLAFLRMHEEMRVLERQQEEHEEQGNIGDDSAADDPLPVHEGDDSDGNDSVERIQATMQYQHTLSVHRKQTLTRLENERNRLVWVRERKQEAIELEHMSKEDLYYVEKLQRLKQLEHERQLLLVTKKAGNPLEEQQKKIERMRQLDLERKTAEKESERMRTEDLFARQWRYLEAERRKLQEQCERFARKQMEMEERDCRSRWKLVEMEQAHLEELEAKRLRVEARRMRKWQQAYDKQVLAAWVESWDTSGNVYFYNTVTGVSQWESPFVAQ